ncbi:MAG: phenylacetate--CoA ligase family protein [Nitrososphaerota archaeon]|nr:phenylacetate--CoA ligase family protein [Nitrososphaerota archaeon]MDG6942099.1 phenylacetate--CoA ligase family protein [Nitrososphaerota archaeon]MDG6942564.1 phenylacetate--CoA ligase family protein [Nitrososphaerota archaeon]MDG6948351.1 phenylacetate--CoA ligase family protein [Nitrososphaerota archaeon]MDG6950277.1 phenylacetate--CoA ligase family protein [Nitrososphaerota archaeon]
MKLDFPKSWAHYAGVTVGLASAMRSYRFSVQDLRKLQDEKLRRLVRHVNLFVPYYKSAFKRSGLVPEDIKGVADLKKLPFLTKEDIRRDVNGDLRSRGALPEFAKVTSGTTGASVGIAYSREFITVRDCLYLRRLMNFGLKPWDKVVTVWDPPRGWRTRIDKDGSVRSTTQLAEVPFATFLGRPIPQVKVLRSIPSDVEMEAARLAALNPSFIFCRPSHLRRIGVAMRSGGQEIAAKGLICTNEILTDSCAKELEVGFKAKTLRMYGSTEAGSIGADCRFKTGIHLNEDYTIFEVIRDGEQVAPGESGELVVTQLHNPSMPLIRYPVGDLVELAEEGTCPCGSNLRRLRSVHGKAVDCLLGYDGARVSPLQVADAIESGFGLRDFQIIQTEPTRFRLRVSPGSALPKDALEGIVEYLASVVGAHVYLTVEARPEGELWSKARPLVILTNHA